MTIRQKLSGAARISASGGKDGARLVLERARRLDPAVVKKALNKANVDDVFDLLDRALAEEVARNETQLHDVLLDAPAVLRDARWLEVAKGLPKSGRNLLITMARDPKNPCRTKAVDQLAEEAKRVSGWSEKREAVYALGQTGQDRKSVV